MSNDMFGKFLTPWPEEYRLATIDELCKLVKAKSEWVYHKIYSDEWNEGFHFEINESLHLAEDGNSKKVLVNIDVCRAKLLGVSDDDIERVFGFKPSANYKRVT